MVACLNDWGYAGRGSIGGTVPCDRVTQHEQTREKGGKRGGIRLPAVDERLHFDCAQTRKQLGSDEEVVDPGGGACTKCHVMHLACSAWDGTVIMRVRVPRQLHAFQPCEAVRRGDRDKLRITVAAVEIAAYDHGIARKEMIGQGHVEQLQVMQAHAGGVVSAAPRRVNTHAPQTRVVQLYARRARAFVRATSRYFAAGHEEAVDIFAHQNGRTGLVSAVSAVAKCRDYVVALVDFIQGL